MSNRLISVAEAFRNQFNPHNLSEGLFQLWESLGHEIELVKTPEPVVAAKGVSIKLPAEPHEIALGILMLVKTWNIEHHDVPYRTEIHNKPNELMITFHSLSPFEIELNDKFNLPQYGI